MAYKDLILAAIAKENRHFENDRGFAKYIHEEVLKEKVYSLYPSTEIVDGGLAPDSAIKEYSNNCC